VKAALLEYRRGLRLHDLGHTYVSLLSSNGAHMNVIAELGGHSTAATTDACRHPHDDVHDTTADLLDPV
jgi:integrase